MPTETEIANRCKTGARRHAAALKLHWAQIRMDAAKDAFIDAEDGLADAYREFETAYDADVLAGGPV